jgi:hypothetical protein
MLVPEEAALREDERALGGGKTAKQPPHDLLGVSKAVQGGGIDPVDPARARVASSSATPRRLAPPSRTAAAGADGPGSESKLCDLESAAAEGTSRQTHHVAPCPRFATTCRHGVAEALDALSVRTTPGGAGAARAALFRKETKAARGEDV